MSATSKLLVLLFIAKLTICCASRTNDEVNISLELMLNEKEIVKYLSEESISTSSNHNINYNLDYDKFLIGNRDCRFKQIYHSPNRSKLVVRSQVLPDGYCRSYLQYDNIISYDFYSKDRRVISRSDYHTLDWQSKDSKYVNYHYPQGIILHNEAIAELNERIESFFEYFPDHNNIMKRLESNKLDYYYCPDQATIEKLTGYETRGILLLNQDRVISTFPAHFHEVVHFLINYYLSENQLYTHPFLQEGLAVAIGGRGGMLTSAVLESGNFLVDSDFINYNELMSVEGFNMNHPSLSYPVSGLLTRMMLQHYTSEEYLELYKKYSNSSANIPAISELTWITKDAIIEYSTKNIVKTIIFNCPETKFQEVVSDSTYKISHSKNYYKISFDDTLTQINDFVWLNVGDNQRFKLKAIAEEIKIKDCYLDEIVASWSKSFLIENEDIPQKKGHYYFYIDKSLFQ